MFERVKCYRKIMRAEKILRGCVRVGEILENEKMIKDSEEALVNTLQIKKKMWCDRGMAKRYNLEFEAGGFK